MIKINDLVIDLCISETHTHDVEVTENPTEKGQPIVDHARLKPLTIALECMVSNSPRRHIQTLRNGLRAQQVLTQLQLLLGKLVRVQTPRGVWENMVIASLSHPITADSGNEVRFSLQLKEVRIVDAQSRTQRVAIPNVAKAKALGGKAANAVAANALKNFYGNIIPNPPTEKRKSMLFKGAEAIGWR